MRIATVFSGVGSPEQAAKRVYPNHELIFACEWDKFARESFKANYAIQEKHFHKDISDLDGTQYKDKVDILIGGSPCQDFSLAGLRKGIDGNKGILIYEYIRIIEEVNPPIFIYENVKGMLSDKHGRTIKEFVHAFREMGYHCHYEVLNTKDYGVPQNRERIFLVGFKDTEHYYNFNFAPKMKLEKRLKDVLESDVDEKYYYDGENKRVDDYIKNKTFKDYTFIDVYSKLHRTKYAGCMTTRTDASGLTYVKVKQVPQTLDCACSIATIDENRIRKLTPRECFRLQDFPDDFKFVVSNSQL